MSICHFVRHNSLCHYSLHVIPHHTSLYFFTPLCRFSLHVRYPTLNVTGVPKNVAFHCVGLSTHTLPGILQLV
jgi:hypothetical protein